MGRELASGAFNLTGQLVSARGERWFEARLLDIVSAAATALFSLGSHPGMC